MMIEKVTKTVHQHRLENLKKLVEEVGGVTKLSQLAGYKQPSYLYQILNRTVVQNGKPKNIGSNMARKLEEATGKESGWLDIRHDVIINQNNSSGTQNNLGSGIQQNHTNNFFNDEQRKEYATTAPEFLTAMPLLGIDDGVSYAINPASMTEKIKDNNERIATFIPHSQHTFGVKVAHDIAAIAAIKQNDIVVIEPKIPPRDNDLVLVCLDYQQPNQRGLLARLHIDLHNTSTIQYNNEPATVLPPNSLICGVVVEIKRRLLPNDLVASRINTSWDIKNTLTKPIQAA